jgi:Ku70/Ku80 beta-barrel domain
MPRSIWNGTVTFGLVHVPVKLYSAVESKAVHFHEVHEKDGARIEHRRFCPKEDSEVPYDEVVKGFEVSRGEYVVLEKDEIAAAAGESSHIIAVEAFFCAADIDPVFYDMSSARRTARDGRCVGPRLRVRRPPGSSAGRAGAGQRSGHRVGAQDAVGLGQTSVLSVGSDRIDTERLQLCFELEESTSASTLLLSSIDGARGNSFETARLCSIGR